MWIEFEHDESMREMGEQDPYPFYLWDELVKKVRFNSASACEESSGQDKNEHSFK